MRIFVKIGRAVPEICSRIDRHTAKRVYVELSLVPRLWTWRYPQPQLGRLQISIDSRYAAPACRSISAARARTQQQTTNQQNSGVTRVLGVGSAHPPDFIFFWRRAHAALKYKKLSYRRGTARCVVSIEILPIASHAIVQKLLIRQVLTKSMVWSWRFSRRQCVIDNVYSTMTRPSRLPLSRVS